MAATNGEKRFEDLKEDFERLEADIDLLKKELNEEDKEIAIKLTKMETTLEDLLCEFNEMKVSIKDIGHEVRENRERSLENSWKTKLMWGAFITGTGAIAGGGSYVASTIFNGMKAGIGMFGFFGG